SVSTETLEDFIFAGAATSKSDLSLPGTIQKAYAGPDVECWKPAVEDELLTINSNHVYETILTKFARKEGIAPITSKPVFHIKHNHTGNV
ncbi:hypothetical protein PAXRUDRAFT_56872, partial [Paxillus rubicundulus Ve08.2h10]